MNTTPRIVPIILFVLALASFAVPTATTFASLTPGDYARGSVRHVNKTDPIWILVDSDPTNTYARGSFEAISGGVTYRATATCVLMSGNSLSNRMIVTGWLTSPQSAYGQLVVMDAVDNTDGLHRDGIRMSFAGNGGIYPSSKPGCYLPVFAPVPVTSGNITVYNTLP